MPRDMPCIRMLYYTALLYPYGCIVYIHIGVGSALLVSINRVMRRPQNVRRVTGTGSHAFFV